MIALEDTQGNNIKGFFTQKLEKILQKIYNMMP